MNKVAVNVNVQMSLFDKLVLQWVAAEHPKVPQLFVSCPNMKQLTLNLYWDDTVSVGSPPRCSTNCGGPIVSPCIIKSTDDIAKACPELVCGGEYPPRTTQPSLRYPSSLMTRLW